LRQHFTASPILEPELEVTQAAQAARFAQSLDPLPERIVRRVLQSGELAAQERELPGALAFAADIGLSPPRREEQDAEQTGERNRRRAAQQYVGQFHVGSIRGRLRKRKKSYAKPVAAVVAA